MKEITLTLGKVALVDDGDYESLSEYRWMANLSRSSAAETYYARKSVMVNGKRRFINMGRFLLKVEDKNLSVVYLDHDGLNCQRSNLAIMTRKDIRILSRKKKGNFYSDFRGVSYYKRDGLWQTSCNGINKRFFESEIDAARAFDELAIKEYGNLARLNFPIKEKRA